MIEEFKGLIDQLLVIRTAGLMKWTGVASILGLGLGMIVGKYLHFGWAVVILVLFCALAPLFKAALDE